MSAALTSPPSSDSPAFDSSRSSPPLFVVPKPRNPNFVGRDRDLAGLRATLAGPTRFARVQVLGGPPGVGKTQLALEYAHRYRDAYDVVAWVRCDDRDARAADLAAVAARLGFVPPAGAGTATPGALTSAVHDALEARTGWLLILDNAPGPDAVASLVPASRGGHVIVTSRAPGWGESAALWPVGPLERGEAVTLLRRRAGRNSDTTFVTARLAQALGDLPLALDQAAAVVAQSGISFEEYLNRFEAHWGEMLRRGRPSDDYPATVAMTWDLSFRQVREESPAAADLLNLLAFMAAEPVGRDTLRLGADWCPAPLAAVAADAGRLEGTVGVLQRYALVETVAAGGGLVVNRLVATLARDRLSPAERATWAETALNVVDGAFGFDANRPATWRPAAALLPHATVTIRHATGLGAGVRVAASLLNEVGQLLFRNARYAEARDALDRAMALAFGLYGEDNPRLSPIANNLGRVLARTGNLPEARRHFEWAAALDERAYGPNHPHVAEVLNNLGNALLRSGQLDDGLAKLRRALDIARVAAPLHGYDPQSAVIANNIGYALLRSGDVATARSMLEDARAALEAAWGDFHPDLAAVEINIGNAARAAGDVPAALARYERAAEVLTAVHGPDHPDVARALADAGRALLDLNRPVEARHRLARALAVDEQVFGPAHPTVAQRRADLAAASQAPPAAPNLPAPLDVPGGEDGPIPLA